MMSDMKSGATRTATLRSEYHRRRRLLYRARYGEHVVVKEHVHTEALLVFDKLDGVSRLLAGGLRLVIRPTAVDEVPRESHGNSWEETLDKQWIQRWLDPRSQPHSLDRPREIFVDLTELGSVVDGLDLLATTAGEWRRSGFDWDSMLAEREAVFSWGRWLSFRIVQRSRALGLIVQSGEIGFTVSDGSLYSFARWSKSMLENLTEQQTRILKAQRAE